MAVLEGLEPKLVFRYFEKICGIPHGSGNTKAISDYCAAFAKERGLRYAQDQLNNVIIWKKGTPGYEQSLPVMIQGHLDMVCEKTPDCPKDLARDGISLIIEDGMIGGEGTTLGGDDGIAVAFGLALLDSEDIPHPPLEVVLTVDEEIGMFGAEALDCSLLQAKRMLNIDSEDEGILLVSCAGGSTVTCRLPVKRTEASGICAELCISGLTGGHSGMEINKGRGNGAQLLGRVLYALDKKIPYALVSVDGGQKDNAILRQARAVFMVPEEKAGACKELTKKLEKILQAEYAAADQGLSLQITFGDAGGAQALDAFSKKAVLAALVNLPGGVQRMSPDIPGLVQTSLNLGILRTKEQEVSMRFAVRSSVETEKEEVISRICCLTEYLGGTVERAGEYPAWEYRRDSALRDLMVQVFEEQYGRKPVVEAVHAGLECGLFAGKIPGLDCISLGPDIKEIHTTRERLCIDSVKRTWEYVLEVLKRLK